MRNFSIRDRAKSDVDSVVEIHQQEVIATLKTLAIPNMSRGGSLPVAASGALLLIANASSDNGMTDLSIEREFGKFVGIQDTLAKVIEDKTNGAIRFGVVNAAGSLFLAI